MLDQLNPDRLQPNQLKLQPDQRARLLRSGAIEEEPHAQCFGALHGYQAHLPAKMINVVQPIQLSLVVIGVALQPRDALLNRLPELRGDLESFLSGELNGH
jgi:hypothetical protein